MTVDMFWIWSKTASLNLPVKTEEVNSLVALNSSLMSGTSAMTLQIESLQEEVKSKDEIIGVLTRQNEQLTLQLEDLKKQIAEPQDSAGDIMAALFAEREQLVESLKKNNCRITEHDYRSEK
ncbi:hypothetical protein Btru_023176 [Bulinus truncatus]|nr:hypothetical protein Btru_023176 [Bulinus truncatus]